MTRDPGRVAAMIEARDEHAREVVATESTFPVHELPAFVLERFPALILSDPETWPEPDACTDGRPWGHSAYGSDLAPRYIEDRWRRWLAAFDAGTPRSRWQRRELGCRNRWRDEEARLCGTHVKPYRDRINDARRRLRVEERRLRHVDLAKRLAAHGIVADGHPSGVLLQADAVEDVLRLLAGAWPSTDTTVPPPL